ncbi:MAG: MoxR family ATPase [Treponema sp.]|jgi:MoxR-like ATPase|nr:MoxR family ATPase [Treponema sp.]
MEVQPILDSCRKALANRVIGQEDMIDGLLMTLIAGGHILLEGVPGLAKTLAVKSLADITGLVFKRIQFTPDLLPADLTGTMVWEQAAGTFSVRRGPIFANVILADEINRAPAKVQSALLEAMEEMQVTIGETTYSLPHPFFVLATQNPIEHEGTYALPEAELDRFLLKLLIKYPHPEQEVSMLSLVAGRKTVAPLPHVLTISMLKSLQTAADAVHVDERLAAYIVSVVGATRLAPVRGGQRERGERIEREGIYRYINFGASPRASIALYRCARIHALFEGRSFISPDDVKAVALPVLRHRIVLSYEAEADGLDPDAVISRILSLVPVP